jgi:formate dehydrogenase subunit delta
MAEDDLVRMANQIADFYQPYPRDEAVQGVAEHISMFWETRMRSKLSALIEIGNSGLSDIALVGANIALKR